MTILSDKEIIKLAEEHQMIVPFQSFLIREASLPECNPGLSGLFPRKLISYGLSSYGYDIRLSPNEFRIFRHIPGTVINPKAFNPDNLEEVRLQSDAFGDYFIIPAYSYGLGVAMETLKMPRDVTAICMGKSTYARCFTGDTKVKLVDGDFTFMELIERWNRGERLHGFSVINEKIEIQELTEPRYIEDSEIIRVWLDNESHIDCTPDHQFRLRNGEYKEAQHLQPLDSLHPIYTYDNHGYPSIYDSVQASNEKHRLNAMMSLPRMVWAAVNGDLAKGMHVHHKDGNKLNNHPDNLEAITASEHARLHNLEDGRFLTGGEEFKKKYLNDADFRDFINSRLHSEESKRLAYEGRSEYLGSDLCSSRLKDAREKRWLDPEQHQKQSEVAFKGIGSIKRRNDVTTESLTAALLGSGSIRGAARILNVDRTVFKRFPDVMDKFRKKELAYNHKVSRLEKLSAIQPTYCLTAPGSGNFALASGVFVKNCGIIANITPAEAGWTGNLTLEMSNSSSADSRVYAGEGICQLLFLKGSPCETSYADRSGKYQGQGERITLPKV